MFIDSERKRKERLADIIEQHRIVYSKQLDKYYKESLPFAILDSWQIYITNRNDKKHDICYLIDSKDADGPFDDAISMIRKYEQIGSTCVLCGECDKKEELEKKMYPEKPVFLSTILDENVSNTIGRMTADFHTRAKKGSKSEEYSEWICELFMGEKEIIISDRFILDEQKLKTFEEYYIKRIAKGSVLKLYTSKIWEKEGRSIDENKNEETRIKKWLKAKAELYSITIQVFICKNKSLAEHPRYIYFSSYRLRIEYGLDFLDAGTNGVVKNTYMDFEKRSSKDDELMDLATNYAPYTVYTFKQGK